MARDCCGPVHFAVCSSQRSPTAVCAPRLPIQNNGCIRSGLPLCHPNQPPKPLRFAISDSELRIQSCPAGRTVAPSAQEDAEPTFNKSGLIKTGDWVA